MFGTEFSLQSLSRVRAKRWPRSGRSREGLTAQINVAVTARVIAVLEAGGHRARASRRHNVRHTSLHNTNTYSGAFFHGADVQQYSQEHKPTPVQAWFKYYLGGVVLTGFERGFPSLEQTLVIFRSEGRHIQTSLVRTTVGYWPVSENYHVPECTNRTFASTYMRT